MFHALKVKSNITIHLVSLCWKLTVRRLHNCIGSLRRVNFPNCQDRQFKYYSLEDMYSIRLYIVHDMRIKPPTVSMQTFVPLTNKSTTEINVYLSVRFTIRGIICTCVRFVMPCCGLVPVGYFTVTEEIMWSSQCQWHILDIYAVYWSE